MSSDRRVAVKTRARFGAVAHAAVLIVALSACGENGGPPASPVFPPASVKLAVADVTAIEDATDYVATLRSLDSTTIQPQIEGQITRIFVKSGDSVTIGTPLVQIDPRRQQAAVSSLEAERVSREAKLAYARSQAERARELYTAGAISKQELEQAETALPTAEADLRALEAQIQQQQVQLRYYRIVAPTVGVVGDVPVRVGNQVSPQTVLTTIDRNDTLEVHVPVPMHRANDLRRGLPLQVWSGEGQERLTATTVGFVSPSVEDQTQTILVKGVLRNPDARLRSSQFVRARIVWKVSPGLVIPVVAVVRINGQPFAFVAEPGKNGTLARQRAVKLGAIVGDGYEVLAGLQAGERVVVSGAQKLADGAPIAPAS